jgi:hypothetical protein
VVKPVPTSTITRPTDAQAAAATSFLFAYLRLDPRDHLALVYGPDRTVEATWLCALARSRGVDVTLVFVAEMTKAHLRRRVAAATAGPATAGRSAVVVLSDEDIDPGWLPDAPPTVLVQLAALDTSGSPLDVWAHPSVVATAVADLRRDLDPWTGIRIVSAGGATIRLSGMSAAATSVDIGDLDPDGLRVLPAGHVEARPSGADGIFVADGAIHVNRATRLGRSLAAHPVAVTVTGGRVTEVRCDDPAIAGFLGRAVTVHRLGLVGSVRFGAHPQIRTVPTVACGAHAAHAGIALRLSVDPADAYSIASADLRVDLVAATATWQPDSSPVLDTDR